jgi:hypothetical protein
MRGGGVVNSSGVTYFYRGRRAVSEAVVGSNGQLVGD